MYTVNCNEEFKNEEEMWFTWIFKCFGGNLEFALCLRLLAQIWESVATWSWLQPVCNFTKKYCYTSISSEMNYNLHKHFPLTGLSDVLYRRCLSRWMYFLWCFAQCRMFTSTTRRPGIPVAELLNASVICDAILNVWQNIYVSCSALGKYRQRFKLPHISKNRIFVFQVSDLLCISY